MQQYKLLFANMTESFGLGELVLDVCGEPIEAMGGTIGVRSELGVGSVSGWNDPWSSC